MGVCGVEQIIINTTSLQNGGFFVGKGIMSEVVSPEKGRFIPIAFRNKPSTATVYPRVATQTTGRVDKLFARTNDIPVRSQGITVDMLLQAVLNGQSE